MAYQEEPRKFSPDGFVDPQSKLLGEFISADLVGIFGPGAVGKVYYYDAPIELLTQTPALIIHRMGERTTMEDPGAGGVEVGRWLIKYIAPVTPLQRLDARWPLLRAVYTRIRLILSACQSPYYNDGRVSQEVIDAGTWRDFESDYSAVAGNTASVFPYVTVTITSERQIVLDFDSLEDLTDLLRVDFHISADIGDGTPAEFVNDRIIE